MSRNKPRIDKVVTKTGDEGYTHIIGGTRISKASLQVDSYGTVDELNAVIGLIISALQKTNEKYIPLLKKIQNDLFIAGADLASPADYTVPRISTVHIEALESAIAEYQQNLEALQDFILPGGIFISALLHFARTVTRRAERAIVRFNETEKINPHLLVYFNRLSDLFFIIARMVNKESEVQETYCDFNK